MSTENDNQTKRKIKSVALALFNERGFENVTLNDICDRCGVNKHTFYYYFSSKDELLHSYFQFPDSIDLSELNGLLSAPSCLEQICLIIKPFVAHVEKTGPKLSKQLFAMNLTSDALRSFRPERVKATLEAEMEIIRKGQEAGEFGNGSDPEALAVLIHHLLMGASYVWALLDGSFDLQNAARYYIENVLDLKRELRTAKPMPFA